MGRDMTPAANREGAATAPTVVAPAATADAAANARTPQPQREAPLIPRRRGAWLHQLGGGAFLEALG